MKKRYFNIQHNSHKKQFCTKAVLVGILSVLVFFSSCSNAFLDGGSASGVKTGTITGSIDFGGALPKEILDQLNSSSKNSDPQGERTAFPSIPTASSVEVYAQIGNDTTKISATNVSTTSYKLGGLEFGKEYTITAKFKNDSEKIIMQGSVKVTLSDDEPVVNKNISVAPTQTNGGEGSISLSFSVAGDVGWSSSNVACSYFLDNNLKQSNDYPNNGIFPFEENYIPSGAHSVKFIFKQKVTNYILYQFTETINVFDNLTTDTWVKNGDEPYLITSGNTTTCQITKECVDKFAQKTFYVDSTRQTTNSSGAGYTTQSGTYFNPFVTFAKAVEKAEAVNETSCNVQIFVKTTESESTRHKEILSSTLTPYINLTAETYVNTPGDKKGKVELIYSGTDSLITLQNGQIFNFTNFIFNGKNNNTYCTGTNGFVHIAESADATFTNCEFINAKTVGIFCNGSSTKCTLHNCDIKNNIADNNGGGINNQGNLTLNNCTISGNKAKNGGGIYNEGTLTFKGKCVIGDESKTTTANDFYCSNKATSNGGGLYLTSPFTVDSGSKLYVCHNFSNSYGGGIYVKLPSSQTLNDVVVKYCFSNFGGGVFIYSSEALNCKNFDIENCTADSSCGGIFVFDSDNLKISDSKILNCQCIDKGAGLYLDISTTVLENVCVENCTGTETGANGVYINNNNDITIKGSTYIDEASYVYLSDYCKIDVPSSLTPKDHSGVAKDKVATIRPESYDVGNQVLTGIKVGSEYFKFAVTPEASDKMWGINSNGKLIEIIGTKAPGNYAVGDIVFNDGSATPYSEGLTLTEEQKNAAIAVIFRVGDGSEGNKTLGVGIKYSNERVWCKSASVGCNGANTRFNTDCPQDEGTSAGSLTFKNSLNTDGSKNLKIMIQDLSDQNDTGVTFLEDGTIDFDNSAQTTLRNNYPAFEFAYYYGKNEGHNITSGSAFENGWYLPSISELNDIYQANKNQVIQNAFGVTENSMITDLTWSSSQGNKNNDNINNSAKVFHFSNGSVSGDTKFYNSYYVYAIRAFN